MKEVMKDIVVIIQSEKKRIDINLNDSDQPYKQDVLEDIISTKEEETKQRITESYFVS